MRIPASSADINSAVSEPSESVAEPRRPRGQGRKVKQGTVLAREMERRRLRKSQVAGAMGCSDRQLYNYMARRAAIPGRQLGPLCDLLDMDPEELVDGRNYLRAL